MKGRRMQRQGFTLVELMIVVLIIGALATITVSRIMGGATTAKVNVCKANIDLLNKQIELYYANNGSYPSELKDVTEDTDYFPDGDPVCPITDAEYPDVLTGDNRVNVSGHAH
jgi:general secretion pathway protein G